MKHLFTVLCIMCFSGTAYSQLVDTLTVEDIYGGRINAISVSATSDTTSIIYITTESANSAFYATYESGSGTSSFVKVPDLTNKAGYGSGIQSIATDSSKYMYFIHQQNLYSVSTTSNSLTQITSGGLEAVYVYKNWLFYVQMSSGNRNLYFGTLSGGSFTANSNSPINTGFTTSVSSIHIHPQSLKIMLFAKGQPPTLSMYSQSYDAMTNSGSFSSVSVSGLGSSDTFHAFQVAPDGRFLVGTDKGTEPNHFKTIFYSDDSGTNWTEVSTAISGTSGNNIAISGDSASYHVYFGTAFSTNKGESSWASLGHTDFETHPNDGMVVVDPTDHEHIYLTTDQGIGASDDQGESIFEINQGVEAVQLNDFSINDNKKATWAASKSGLWFNEDFSDRESWLGPYYPNGDGSPYYTITMDTTNTLGKSVYAGNSRVYYKGASDTSWTKLLSEQQHGLEFWAYVSDIALDYSTTPHRIFASFYDPGETTRGGIFVSEDGGTSWAQITSSLFANDSTVDIHALQFIEENGSQVLYAGSEYYKDNVNPTSRSIYKITGNISSGFTVSQDMLNDSINISASIYGFTANSSGTLYACGTDAGGNHPIVYSKLNGDSIWTALTTSGLPTSGNNLQAKSITIDPSTGDLYIAVQESIYYLASGSSSWSTYYTYPNGTQLNFVYFDELLAGTEIGLHSFDYIPPQTDTLIISTAIHQNDLATNYSDFYLISNLEMKTAKVTLNDSALTLTDVSAHQKKTGLIFSGEGSYSLKSYVTSTTNLSDSLIEEVNVTKVTANKPALIQSPDGHLALNIIKHQFKNERYIFSRQQPSSLGTIYSIGKNETTDLAFIEYTLKTNETNKAFFFKTNNGWEELSTIREGNKIRAEIKQLGDFRVGVGTLLATIPNEYKLHFNYPNPFNPTTTIEYSLPEKSSVRITIFNVLGQHVKTLIRGVKDAGLHSVTWDGTNTLGTKVSSGVYFYQMNTHSYHRTLKMILIK